LLAFRSRLDQARLEPAEEDGVLRERLRELAGKTTSSCGLGRQLFQARCAPVYDLIAPGHFFVGGSSPVPIRHTLEAARRAAIVAAAVNPAYRPDHSAFRSTVTLLAQVHLFVRMVIAA